MEVKFRVCIRNHQCLYVTSLCLSLTQVISVTKYRFIHWQNKCPLYLLGCRGHDSCFHVGDTGLCYVVNFLEQGLDHLSCSIHYSIKMKNIYPQVYVRVQNNIFNQANPFGSVVLPWSVLYELYPVWNYAIWKIFKRLQNNQKILSLSASIDALKYRYVVTWFLFNYFVE